jgi:hypothetical protein
MKSFCGVQGQFLQKEPLAAGGTRSFDRVLVGNPGWTYRKFSIFFSFYVHPVDKKRV